MSELDKRLLSSHDDHWIPLSDLMTGLMMIFLLIAISYMIKVDADTKAIKQTSARTKEIVTLYEQMKSQLYNDLRKEFEKDLPRWDAELLPDAAIRFKAPDVLFDSGQSVLKPRFENILAEFFPRYIAIIGSKKYRTSIKEIRIEGYTSSFWQSATTQEDAYFQNMRLSQDRTRSTLEYVMGLPAVASDADWLRKHITANGLSSSKLIYKGDGKEDFSRSQRVEFRVRTDADARIEQIIEATK
jgi:outer membrane protein OmpA-like peptidoglycan-associated protein